MVLVLSHGTLFYIGHYLKNVEKSGVEPAASSTVPMGCFLRMKQRISKFSRVVHSFRRLVYIQLLPLFRVLSGAGRSPALVTSHYFNRTSFQFSWVLFHLHH